MANLAEQSSPGSERVQPADQWLEAVKREERRGELLAAFDIAERGLAQHPDDLALKHRAVLALARAGATEEAARRFDEYGLGSFDDEDIAALHARIAKDTALGTEGVEREQRAQSAADAYAAIFRRTGGYYPAINAATLSLIAGQRGRAGELAREVLELVKLPGESSYYAAASAGEAYLLLGDPAAAGDALKRAAALHGGDYGALATTRRQLRLVCEVLGVDRAVLSPLAGPAVVHFCGERLAGDGESPLEFGDEAQLARKIEEIVGSVRPGFAYGSLAAGADILWAEALLAAGAELHVVLPFAREEFVQLCVASGGGHWLERFERCLAAAAAVDYATDDAFLGDDVLFRYCSELAMGLALLRARYLDADVRQLALWDEAPLARTITRANDNDLPERTLLAPSGDALTSDRVVRAMLFGDVKGFSKLTDEQLPVFARAVLGAFADAVNSHRGDVWHRNTWGDALYAVLSDAPVAAACALELQESLARIEFEAIGLPAHLALRLGGHLGPVFPTHDPVIDTLSFMGSHVSRTARIEPVTPPGTVYVTEQFAAALVLDGSESFTCDYVGRMPAAKDYGLLRMYRLRRRA